MSRCSPYFPPELKNSIRSRSLLEVFKLKKEQDEAIKQDKLKKIRERKAQKQESREKEKADKYKFSKRRAEVEEIGSVYKRPKQSVHGNGGHVPEKLFESSHLHFKTPGSSSAARRVLQQNKPGRPPLPPAFVPVRSSTPHLGEVKASREEKKEKRRQKKQLKREAKEKEKSHKSATVGSTERGHKKRRRDEGEEVKKADSPKQKVKETLPYEKSNLTEEHECPLACAADKSAGFVMGSNKKQTTSLLPDCEHNNSGGTFRIRLPLQRHEEAIPFSASSTVQLRLRTDDLFPAKLREEKLPTVQPPPVSAQVQKEQPCLPPCTPPIPNSSTVDIRHQTKLHSSSSTLRGSRVPSAVKKYRKLFDNWAPPPLQTELMELSDLDWLFQKSSDRTCRASDTSLALPTILSYSTSSPAVHSCYLPEADVYALPYTVPF